MEADRCLTPRWSGRVEDKVPSPYFGARALSSTVRTHSMETQVPEVAGRGDRWKSMLIALGLLSGATLALVVALYLWSYLGGRTPPMNWFLAVLIGLTTLGLAVAFAISRPSLKTTSIIIAIGAACTAVGFIWGPIGILSALVAGNIVTSVVAWRKRCACES